MLTAGAAALAAALALSAPVPNTMAASPPSPAAAEAPPDRDAARVPVPRAVLILLPSLDWPEFLSALRAGAMPETHALLERGAIGLLNAQTGGKPAPEDAYVTLGAGARAAGGRAAGEGFARGERLDGVPAAAVYRVRTGQPAPAGAILHVGLAGLAAAAADLDHPAVPGLLGETLHAVGRRIAVFGNADTAVPPGAAGSSWTGPAPGRFAVAVAMDRRGAVDEGLVGTTALRRADDAPGGWRTDTDRLAAGIRQALAGGAGLVVVDTGDLWRIHAQRERMSPVAYVGARQEALARADRLVGVARRALDLRRDLLLVLSPFPSEEARQEGVALTPAVAWGRGFGPGLLTSGTTRHAGIAANTDVAPAILTAHGLPAPPAMSGRPLGWSAAGAASVEDRLDRVDALYRQTVANHARRPFLIKAYIFFAVAVLALASLALARRLPVLSLLEPCLVALTAIPLSYLLLALWPGESPLGAYGAALAITFALTALALAAGRGDWMRPFTAVALGTAMAVALDTLLGLDLMSRSPLGHSLIGGARFYGIGNEYMGVMVGASLMAGTALAEARPGAAVRLAVLAGWAAVTALLAAPSLGANLGGTITAAVAFGFTGVRLFRPRVRPRDVAAVAAAAVAALALVVAFDLAAPPDSRSHIGRAVATTAGEGWPVVAQMAERKLEMNWKLIRWTNWSILFLTSLGVYAWLCLRPPGAVREALCSRPRLALGFGGVALAALVALASNDSGIVAAATAMIHASAPLVRLVAGRALAGDR